MKEDTRQHMNGTTGTSRREPKQQDDNEISLGTLADMDAAMRNFRIGSVSENPVRLDGFEDANGDDVTVDGIGSDTK